jgi:hypothetical protein
MPIFTFMVYYNLSILVHVVSAQLARLRKRRATMLTTARLRQARQGTTLLYHRLVTADLLGLGRGLPANL